MRRIWRCVLVILFGFIVLMCMCGLLFFKFYFAYLLCGGANFKFALYMVLFSATSILLLIDRINKPKDYSYIEQKIIQFIGDDVGE